MRRGRFALTPSGSMHLGNAMTALLAWLQMRSVNGELVLRNNGGPYEPYTQSLRQSYYEEALQKLHENDWLYPCYCSRAELQSIAHAPHGLAAEGSAYPGTCRGVSIEAQAIRAAHKQPSHRFKVANKVMSFHDGVHGEMTSSYNNRLSKRNCSLSIAAARQASTRPEHLLGWLAYWSGIIDRPESVQPNELVEHFSISRIGRHSVVVEQEAIKQLVGKLTSLQGASSISTIFPYRRAPFD
nr:glutamate--tRNA ligase family protein [Paenibacillus sp. S-12]